MHWKTILERQPVCFFPSLHLLVKSPLVVGHIWVVLCRIPTCCWFPQSQRCWTPKIMVEYWEKSWKNMKQHKCASIATPSSTYIHKIPYVSIINWYQVSWSSSTALRSLQLPPASSFNHACTVAMATGWFMAESAARKSRMRPFSSLAVETRRDFRSGR